MVDAKATSVVAEIGDGELAWLEPVLKYIPQSSDVRLLLEQADVNWSVGSYLMISLGLGLALGAAAWILGGSPIYFLIFGAIYLLASVTVSILREQVSS